MDNPVPAKKEMSDPDEKDSFIQFLGETPLTLTVVGGSKFKLTADTPSQPEYAEVTLSPNQAGLKPTDMRFNVMVRRLDEDVFENYPDSTAVKPEVRVN